MSGYTPLFQSLTTGTLCGKWPDIGLWPIVLSLADKNGVVDVTAAYIAGITGLPVDDVIACMGRFCMPDPGSRSSDHNGARLVLLEPHRDWGWVIVNHGKYREKARLSAKSARETAEGINAKRMADRRRPPETAADPLSNTNANKDKNPGRKRPSKFGIPDDFSLTPDLSAYVVKTISDCDPVAMFAKFTDQARAAGWAYADWPRAFQGYVRNAAPGSGHFAAGQYPKKSSGNGLEGVKWL